MKKLIPLLLFLSCVFMSACGIETEETKENFQEYTIETKTFQSSYEITYKIDEISWRITYKDQTLELVENEENEELLSDYMSYVHEVSSSIGMIIYTAFCIVIISTLLFIYRKKKEIAPILLFGCIVAFMYLFHKIIELSYFNRQLEILFLTLRNM